MRREPPTTKNIGPRAKSPANEDEALYISNYIVVKSNIFYIFLPQPHALAQASHLSSLYSQDRSVFEPLLF